MTIRLLLATFLAAGSLTVHASSVDEVMADQPLAYYRLEESSGPTMVSETNMARNGTYLNAGFVALGIEGAVTNDANTAVQFDGEASFIRVPPEAKLVHDTQDFTIECWVRPRDGNMINVLAYRDWESDENYQFYLSGGDGIKVWAGPAAQLMNSAYTYATDGSTWYHAVFTRSGDVFRTYMNGVQVGLDVTNSMTLKYPDTTRHYMMGASGGLDIETQFMKGDADEFACYDRALDPERILEHYTVATVPSTTSYYDTVMADGPLAYYRLGESAGPTAVSETNSVWNGTYMTGGATFRIPGALSREPDKAVRFKGINTFCRVPPSAKLVQDTQDFTVEGWARPRDGGVVNLLAYRDWEFDDNYQFYLSGGDGIKIWAGPAAQLMNSAYTYATDGSTWYHMVFTRSGDVFRTYMNGEQVGGDVTSSMSLKYPDVTRYYMIGAAGDLGGEVQQLNGDLDELACYDHALSAERIRRHYEASYLPLPPLLLTYEDFDYIAGFNNLSGNNGGTGFNGAWREAFGGFNDGDVISPGLCYTDGVGRVLVSADNCARETWGRTIRTLDDTPGGVYSTNGLLDASSNIGKDGTVVYVSFLFRLDITDVGYWDVCLHRDGDADGNMVFRLFPGGAPLQFTVNGVTLGKNEDTATHLLVWKFVFTNGDDSCFAYLDPPLDAEPETATTNLVPGSGGGNFSFDRISMSDWQGANYTHADEWRIGTSWRDVTPIQPIPDSVITTTTSWVTFDDAYCAIAGTNNENVVGDMWVTNADAGGGAISFPAKPSWVTPPVSLVVGSNLITVAGSNSMGEICTDSIVIMRGPAGTGVPVIWITNADGTVAYDVESLTIAGTNNENVVGGMWWTNFNLGQAGRVAALPAWSIPLVGLAYGTNHFQVYGTNVFEEMAVGFLTIIRAMPPAPYVEITTASTTLPYTVTSIALSGTNNGNVVGGMSANNTLGGSYYYFDAVPAWTSPAVHLYYGFNELAVSGTNIAGVQSYDYVTIYCGGGLTNCVSPLGGNVWPYTNWADAALTIQDAVDAAVAGNVVLVSNGVYATGGRPYPGYGLTNRVMVTNALAVASLAGPNETIIVGERAPVAGGCGTGAVRCVMLLAGSLEGFTLSNGATRADGDWLLDVSGGGLYASYASPVRVRNCTVVDNVASRAGGGISAYATDAKFERCVVRNNEAGFGGGTDHGIFFDCLFTGNRATSIAGFGGGAAWVANLVNCTVASNTSLAVNGRGGVGCQLGEPVWITNCIVWGNTAPSNTAAANYTAPGFFAQYTCAEPVPPTGVGNIGADPLFIDPGMDNYRLSLASPCCNIGLYQPWMAGATDLDGNPRVVCSTVDLGCFEMQTVLPFIQITSTVTAVASPTGPITLWGTNNDVVVGMMWVWNATHAGPTQSFAATPAWMTPPVALGYGTNRIVVSGTNTAGFVASDAINISAGVGMTNYVSLLGSNAWPYTNWAGAATTIQAAVDAALAGNVVLVSNGVYATGGRPLAGFTLTNRVIVLSALTVKSVNGPGATIILGAQDPAPGGLGSNAARCVFMSTGVLEGFTLSNGATCASGDWMVDRSGGGLFSSYCPGVRVSNCIFTANRAERAGGGISAYASASVFDRCIVSGNQAGLAGGTDHGTFFNSLFAGNSAANTNGFGGGAAWVPVLVNCTVVSNVAMTAWGGGGVGCSVTERALLTNCIVWGNLAPRDTAEANFTTGGFFAVTTCTEPLPADGFGNMATNPLFADEAAGDFRLTALSPCREAGTNQDWMLTALDLDGMPRIMPAGAVVDMGAYELVPEPMALCCWMLAIGYWAMRRKQSTTPHRRLS